MSVPPQLQKVMINALECVILMILCKVIDDVDKQLHEKGSLTDMLGMVESKTGIKRLHIVLGAFGLQVIQLFFYKVEKIVLWNDGNIRLFTSCLVTSLVLSATSSASSTLLTFRQFHFLSFVYNCKGDSFENPVFCIDLSNVPNLKIIWVAY